MSVVSLGELVSVQTGKLDANASSPDGPYPFFTCAREPLRISDWKYDLDAILVAGNGDLNVKHYKGKFDAYQRTYILSSKDKNRVDTRYLYHFMDTYLETLRQQSIGGIIKYIKLRMLTDAPIPLPPLDEQKRVAAILDQADELRRKRLRALDRLNQLGQAIFREMFGDPVANPFNWPIQKLGEIGILDRGVSKHRPRNDPALLGGEYPLIQTGDVANADSYIRSFISTYSDLGLKQSKKWPIGTLCITIAANIGKTAILEIEACFPDSVVGFTPSKETNAEYVQFWMSCIQKRLEEVAPQSAQKNSILPSCGNSQSRCRHGNRRTSSGWRSAKLNRIKPTCGDPPILSRVSFLQSNTAYSEGSCRCPQPPNSPTCRLKKSQRFWESISAALIFRGTSLTWGWRTHQAKARNGVGYVRHSRSISSSTGHRRDYSVSRAAFLSLPVM